VWVEGEAPAGGWWWSLIAVVAVVVIVIIGLGEGWFGVFLSLFQTSALRGMYREDTHGGNYQRTGWDLILGMGNGEFEGVRKRPGYFSSIFSLLSLFSLISGRVFCHR